MIRQKGRILTDAEYARQRLLGIFPKHCTQTPRVGGTIGEFLRHTITHRRIIALLVEIDGNRACSPNGVALAYGKRAGRDSIEHHGKESAAAIQCPLGG